jgi:hypothetical protein
MKCLDRVFFHRSLPLWRAWARNLDKRGIGTRFRLGGCFGMWRLDSRRPWLILVRESLYSSRTLHVCERGGEGERGVGLGLACPSVRACWRRWWMMLLSLSLHGRALDRIRMYPPFPLVCGSTYLHISIFRSRYINITHSLNSSSPLVPLILFHFSKSFFGGGEPKDTYPCHATARVPTIHTNVALLAHYIHVFSKNSRNTSMRIGTRSEGSSSCV